MRLIRSYQIGCLNRRLEQKVSGFQGHDCDRIDSVDLVEIQVEESRITEIQIISTYMKIHIWNQDHLIKSCLLDCIDAFMLCPDQKF